MSVKSNETSRDNLKFKKPNRISLRLMKSYSRFKHKLHLKSRKKSRE